MNNDKGVNDIGAARQLSQLPSVPTKPTDDRIIIIPTPNPDQLPSDTTKRLDEVYSKIDSSLDPVLSNLQQQSISGVNPDQKQNERELREQILDYIEAAYLHGLSIENLDTGELEPPNDISEVAWIAERILAIIEAELARARANDLQSLSDRMQQIIDRFGTTAQNMELSGLHEGFAKNHKAVQLGWKQAKRLVDKLEAQLQSPAQEEGK